MAFSGSSTTPSEYSSYDTQRADWLRHSRVGYEARQMYKAPLTTTQDIGWHASKPAPPGQDKRRVLNTTDVTRKEGRTAESYFGMYV